MENHPRFLEVAWAAQRSGLRYTAISTRLTADEVAYILRGLRRAGAVHERALADVARARRRADAPAVGTRCRVDGAPDGFEASTTLTAGCPPSRIPTTPRASTSCTRRARPAGRRASSPSCRSRRSARRRPSPALLQGLCGFGGDTVYLSPAPLYHAAPLRFNMTVHRFGGTLRRDGALRRGCARWSSSSATASRTRRWSRRCSSGCSSCPSRAARAVRPLVAARGHPRRGAVPAAGQGGR